MTTLPGGVDPQQPPQSSWTPAIAIGAFVTALVHAPALFENAFWLPICSCCGCTGAPLGMLPAVIVLRRDPYLGAGSGFAVGFIATGLGAVALAVATLLRGFEFDEAFLQSLRDGWRELGYEEAKIGEMSELLAGNGPLLVVVGAALLALSGGATSAVLAAWTDRRFRRRHAGQTWPPAGPPAAPQ